MEIENILWGEHRVWIPRGKTKKARRFVAMSDRMDDAEELVRGKNGGVGLSFLPVEIRPPHHHSKRLSSGTRSGRLGQKGSSISGAAYPWDIRRGEDKEHLRCGRFDGARQSEVDGALLASRTGTAAAVINEPYKRGMSRKNSSPSSPRGEGWRLASSPISIWRSCSPRAPDRP
jgi:hypothetical protein